MDGSAHQVCACVLHGTTLAGPQVRAQANVVSMLLGDYHAVGAREEPSRGLRHSHTREVSKVPEPEH